MNLNTNTTSHLQIPFYAPFILTGFQHFSPSFLASVWLLGVQSVIAVSLSSWADRSDVPSSQPASFFIFSFSYFFFTPLIKLNVRPFLFFFLHPSRCLNLRGHNIHLICIAAQALPKGVLFPASSSDTILSISSLVKFLCFFFKLPVFSLKHHHFFHNTPPGKFPYIVNVLNGGLVLYINIAPNHNNSCFKVLYIAR